MIENVMGMLEKTHCMCDKSPAANIQWILETQSACNKFYLVALSRGIKFMIPIPRWYAFVCA